MTPRPPSAFSPRTREPPYARPPLSKEFLRGETDDVGLHPAQWYSERRIDLVHTPSTAFTPTHRYVSADGRRYPYSALILATGSAPIPTAGSRRRARPSVALLADARRLRDSSVGAQSAVVIGAGFIGCEAAASLAMRGIPVTLVAPEAVPQEKPTRCRSG